MKRMREIGYGGKLTGLAIILVIIFFLSFFFGRYQISPSDFFQTIYYGIVSPDQIQDSNMLNIIVNVRLPRILMAPLVGCCLAAAGVSYQGIFQNPMASPDFLGASSGAALGAALAIILRMGSAGITLLAFVFAIGTVLLVMFVSSRAPGNRVSSLILAGVIISSLCSSGTSFIKLVADPNEQLPAITYWLMGSISDTRLPDVGRKVLIEACSNAGALTGYQYVGGIAGGVFGNATIDSCCNTGNLEGISFGKVYLGGITGKLGDGTIANCYNTGSLTGSHWNDGHIRAVGGIAGSEEGHDVGIAITNCYTTGKITLHTENMTHGRYYIYMTGNISGGNSVSGENEMQYANCFYLENRLDIADPEHPGYKYWSDVYKKNSLAYDTDTITCVSRSQLKGEAV